jgi:acyl-CoA thioester hydrolase
VSFEFLMTADSQSATSNPQPPILNPPLPADATPLDFRVRYAETDAMGIVHHSRYFPWFEMGRTEYMRERGFTYRELENLGVQLAVIEATCRYRAPARYDDPIRLYTWLAEFSRVRVRFGYAAYHATEGRLLVEAATLHTFVAPDGRPLRITHHPETWARLQAIAPPGTT